MGEDSRDLTGPSCRQCGLAWSEHDGADRLCARVQDETRRRLQLQELVKALRERVAELEKAT